MIATFVSLIPKRDKPKSLNDFRPISLCNLVYKIITNVIANCIKPMLSKEQLGFLDNGKIMDAIVVAQESMHNIKVKKLKYLVMKLDLIKAYDQVSWDFLCLILFQIGLSLEATNWIMGCVNYVNFVVLVNGEPTICFKSSRGLHQGFPLSPLLFLLIIKGLSRMINNAKEEGTLEGVKISMVLRITHLPFVDDVILFGKGFVEE